MNELNEIMEMYEQYLLNLPKGCLIIAELLREENIVSALENISNFSEGVSWIMQANAKLHEEGKVTLLVADKINNFLEEINSGLEIQDFVLVADLFEYEIAPFFELVN